MRVFFFEPYALAVPHFETALELMQKHLDAGDDVHLLHCDADLNFCEANPTHSLIQCLECITRRRNGVNTISNSGKINKRNFYELTFKEKKIINDWNTKFNNINELKAFTYEHVDMGMAIASSLISQHRNPEPDLIAHANLVNRMFKASLKVYFSLKRLIEDEKPDLVYLFNGRFSNIRPVVRLCELNNIPYRIHERGANKHKYSLSNNHLPHDFQAFQKLVEEFWINNSDVDQTKEAEKFFHDRRAGKEQAWYSFTASQKKGELPANWDISKRNIVIFNSSEDEFAAIGDSLRRKLFISQLEGLKFIRDFVAGNNSISVYVRIHPNLKLVKNSSVRGIFDLVSGNFHVIDASSTVNSYDLIEASDLVVSFGSTIGIESTFWDRPSVLLGDSFYKDLGSTYNPQTTRELMSLLLTENRPKEKLGAYKYGFYVSRYGIDYNIYDAKELFNGNFKGERILPSKWVRKYLTRKPFLRILNFISRIHADKF